MEGQLLNAGSYRDTHIAPVHGRKDGMRKYLIDALPNGICGSGQERVISALRKAVREDAEMGLLKDELTFQLLFDAFPSQRAGRHQPSCLRTLVANPG